MHRTLLCWLLFYSCSQSFLQRQSPSDGMLCAIPSEGFQKFSIVSVAHITDCPQLSADRARIERFESQSIMPGTIRLDCSARLPPAPWARPRGACVVAVHRDESFQGHDKGSALGKIRRYCGWISVQWAGPGSNTLVWQTTCRSTPLQPPTWTHTHLIALSVFVQLFICVHVCWPEWWKVK